MTKPEHIVPDALAGGLAYHGVCNDCNAGMSRCDAAFVRPFVEIMQTLSSQLGNKHGKAERLVQAQSGLALRIGRGGVPRASRMQDVNIDGKLVMVVPNETTEASLTGKLTSLGRSRARLRPASVLDIAPILRERITLGQEFHRGVQKALLELFDVSPMFGSDFGRHVARSDALAAARRNVRLGPHTATSLSLLNPKCLWLATGELDPSELAHHAVACWDAGSGLAYGEIQVAGAAPLVAVFGTVEAERKRSWALTYKKQLSRGATPEVRILDYLPVFPAQLLAARPGPGQLELAGETLLRSLMERLAWARHRMDMTDDERVLSDLRAELKVLEGNSAGDANAAVTAIVRFLRLRYQGDTVTEAIWAEVVKRLTDLVNSTNEEAMLRATRIVLDWLHRTAGLRPVLAGTIQLKRL